MIEDASAENASIEYDDDVIQYQDPDWYESGSTWLKVTPWGLRRCVNWVKDHYGDIPIYITENGVSDNLGNTDDLHRIYVSDQRFCTVAKCWTLQTMWRARRKGNWC